MIDPELVAGFQGVLEGKKTMVAMTPFCKVWLPTFVESVRVIWLLVAPWAVKVPYTISEYIPRLTVTPGSIVNVTPLLIIMDSLKLIGLIDVVHSVLVVKVSIPVWA